MSWKECSGAGSRTLRWRWRAGGRARARRAAIGLLLAFGLAPGAAEAQRYQAIVEDAAYQTLPLPGGEPITIYDETDFRGWGYSVNGNQHLDIELPFAVGFFGKFYRRIRLLNDGTITFDPDVGTNTTRNMREIPSSSAPNYSFAAVWWDQSTCNQSNGGPVKTQVVGTAPNRYFVIEWDGCRRYSGTPSNPYGTWQAQLWLSEASDDVIMHYGEITDSNWQAGMGIENSDGSDGVSGPSATGELCSPNCQQADFPSNKRVTYSAGPAIRVEALSGPEEGYAGLPFSVSYALSSPGAKPAENFTVQYWVSTEPRITESSISLGYDGRYWSLAPQERAAVTAAPRLPSGLEEGRYYLIVEADPHHDVELTNRAGAIGIYGPFEIGIRAANLNVPWIESPDIVRPGEPITLRWIARNSGNRVAHSISYRVGIERGAHLSPSSLTLATGRISTLEMESENLIETPLILPDEIEPGIYHLGVEINPDRSIFEHERNDNISISPPVVISHEDLMIVTDSLPQGHLHGHYEYRLVAAGGDGIHRWELQEGSLLPPGMRLEVREAENGDSATFLEGLPSAVGSFAFTLVVRSGDLWAEKEFELRITPAGFDLSIATETLAEAAFGFAYRDELVAIGGRPPYFWETLGEGVLPDGLSLRSDGVLTGRPQQDGSFAFSIVVTDSEGRRALKEFVLQVAPPPSLTCVTRDLPNLRIGEYVEIPLHAAGGRKRPDGTYRWTSSSLVRLARELGEKSGPVEGDFGLVVDPSGVIRGEPKLFGTFAWTLRVEDDSAGNSAVECPIFVRIPRDHGLAITTTTLPTAIVGRSYRAQLSASGGEGALRWEEYGSSRLLGELGFEFDATGNLVGTPLQAALQGEEERSFAITVRVEDARGRIGIGVVNLVLKMAPERSGGEGSTKEGGCQAGGGAATAWLISLCGLVLLFRRRA